jgi:HEAT repeat protein
MALDRLSKADPAETGRVHRLLRKSGLLERWLLAARAGRDSERAPALVRLGRSRTPEAVAALVEALDDPSDCVAAAALRGLAFCGTPEAGRAVIARIRPKAFTKEAILTTLLACFESAPGELLGLTAGAPDALRPLLARVFAELECPNIEGDQLALAADPLAEVRASAARLLGANRLPGAANALSDLAGDREWFVRLRAVAGLGALADPYTIPVLLKGLCDRNRFVRQRAAAALAALHGHERPILRMAALTKDRYAMQALVSEMERSGNIMRLADQLSNASRAGETAPALEAALESGASRLLEDLAVVHQDADVRARLKRILRQRSKSVAADAGERLIEPAKAPGQG